MNQTAKSNMYPMPRDERNMSSYYFKTMVIFFLIVLNMAIIVSCDLKKRRTIYDDRVVVDSSFCVEGCIEKNRQRGGFFSGADNTAIIQYCDSNYKNKKCCKSTYAYYVVNGGLGNGFGLCDHIITNYDHW